VNQDGRHESWPGWIKKLFRLLNGDASQLTPEEQNLSQLAHVAVSLFFLILWWFSFQLVHARSMVRYQQWQICENNLSPNNATRFSLTQQQQQINGTIDALKTATASQKIRLRQQIAEILGLIDSVCQARLYFAAQRVTLGVIGTGAAIVLTVTFGLTATKGIQHANRLALNLGGTALLVLTATVSMGTFFNDNNNLPQTSELYLKTRTLLSAYATDLVNPKLSFASPAELESWMQAKDQAFEPLLVIHINFNDTLMDQVLTKRVPNAVTEPTPTAAPTAPPTGAAQP